MLKHLSIMKPKINYSAYLLFFIGIYIIVNLGFYKSYFSHIKEYSAIVHLHGVVMAGWFIYTIIQTTLMLKGNSKWHKLIGWSSVLLAILIVISIVGITKMGYNRDLNSGVASEKLNGKLLSSYMDILFFSLFYIMAIYNRKNLNRHFKYIIAATLILFGPGIGRFVFFNFPEFKYAMFIVNYYAFIIIMVLWIIECIKAKKILLKNDYLVIIFMLIVYHYINFNFADSNVWQSIAQNIVNVLY